MPVDVIKVVLMMMTMMRMVNRKLPCAIFIFHFEVITLVTDKVKVIIVSDKNQHVFFICLMA